MTKKEKGNARAHTRGAYKYKTESNKTFKILFSEKLSQKHYNRL